MKVTMDGEAHGMMTLAAASAGMVVAFIILGVLITLLLYSRKGSENKVNTISGKSQSTSTNDKIPELFSVTVIGNENNDYVPSELEEEKRNAF